MFHLIIYRLSIYFIIFCVGAEPHDKYNLQLVFNINDEPVIIALDIENYPFRTYYAGIPVFSLFLNAF